MDHKRCKYQVQDEVDDNLVNDSLEREQCKLDKQEPYSVYKKKMKDPILRDNVFKKTPKKVSYTSTFYSHWIMDTCSRFKSNPYYNKFITIARKHIIFDYITTMFRLHSVLYVIHQIHLLKIKWNTQLVLIVMEILSISLQIVIL